MAEETDTEKSRITSLNALEDKVDRLFSMLESKPAPATAEVKTESSSVDEQVNRALATAKAKEAEENEKNSLKEELEKMKAAAEAKPVEYTKLTKMMGWND